MTFTFEKRIDYCETNQRPAIELAFAKTQFEAKESRAVSNSQQVYDTAFRTMGQNCIVKRVTQVRNLAWFVAGLIVDRHCRLTRIVEHLPWAGQDESRVQRLRRVLMNV